MALLEDMPVEPTVALLVRTIGLLLRPTTAPPLRPMPVIRPSPLALVRRPMPFLQTGSFYFGTFHDHSGKPLEGQKTYRLHVPKNVPVREFWSATVYSLKTSSFFLNAERHVSPSA
jgi:Protein of unknown function (DUF1214)